MNKWEFAAAVLAAGIGPCLLVCLRAGVADALVAVEAAGVLACSALVTLAQGLHRQPFVDLALVLAVLTPIGALALARLMEDT